MGFAEGHKHTMALDQSALLKVLDALKAAEVDDKIRQAAETLSLIHISEPTRPY